MTPTVAIDDLKVGMFVHLDLGWWAHPFPLSSFMIVSAEQIATLRGLGLAQVRWSPEKSRLADPEAPAAAGEQGAAAVAQGTPDGIASRSADPPADPPPHHPANPSADRSAHGSAVGSADAAADAPAAAEPPAAASGSAVPHHAEDRPDPKAQAGAACSGSSAAVLRLPGAGQATPAERAAAERRVEQHCVAQLSEARASYLLAAQAAATDPAQAQTVALGLTQAMLDKLSADGDVCVRALSDLPAGDVGAAHALNVMVVSLLLGRVAGLPAADLADLGLGALLHDIGKLALPERWRHAAPALAVAPPASPANGQPPGALPAGVQADQTPYHTHVTLGLSLGRRMGLSEGALQVLAQHHEMADGSGFPQRVGNDRLSPAARIVALVNRYDNLCNPRPGTPGLTPHEALSTLFAQSRGRFDAAVLNSFIRLMGVYPPGSLVQLTDGRWARVLSVNPLRPLKPRVQLCDPSGAADLLLPLDLDSQADLGIRRSVRPAQAPDHVREQLAPSTRVVYFFEPARHLAEHHDEALAA